MEGRSSSWWRRQLRVTWQLPVALGVLGVAYGLWSSWGRIASRPPRVLDLEGTHYEIGLRHGRALKAEIGELFQGYVVGGLVRREGWTIDDLVAIGLHYESFIPRRYVEEMRGIAAGAGVPYEHILVINTFADAVLGARPRACSAFAVWTQSGLVLGRNLDWTNYGIAHRYGVVFRLAARDGHRVLSIAWPGMVGVVTGMNDAGLVLALNMAYAGDLDTNATPMLIRLREALERQTSIQGAAEVLTGQPRTFAANVLVASDTEDRAVVVELSGRRSTVVEMESGLVVTTNYYQRLDIRGGAGADRLAILRRALGRTGPSTTPADARRALAQVCFRGSSLGMVTNQSAVLLPRSGGVLVALGALPATSGRYFEVRLTR
ncbi:MAG: hypothetical protein KA072_15145 [Thermoanaerobaculaceae bacterium]|nr:hypothetical protein [Thermoanaerobaculaceae bacterium]NLH12134.1 hypothetical protein [Holophagae bacterium]